MADLFANLKFKVDGQQSLEQAKQVIGNLSGGVKEAGQTFKDLYDELKAGNQLSESAATRLAAVTQVIGSMDSTAKSTKGQLREYTQLLTDLTATYRGLSDTDKNTDIGKSLAQSIQQLTEKAGQAKDAMADVQASIQNAASDTRLFDQALGAMQFGTSVFQTLQAGASMLGIEMGDNVEIIKKLQSAMAMTQGLQSIQNLIQKQSALRQGTEKLFALIKANPYVAAATALATLTTAVIAYTRHTDKAKEADDALNKAMKEGISNAAEETLKLRLLTDRVHDNALSYGERKEALDILQSVVPDYHASLTEEGNLINDNVDALHDYAQSLVQAAQAQAAFNQMVALQSELLEASDKLRQAQADKAKAEENLRYTNQNVIGGSSITGASTGTAAASQAVVTAGIAVASAQKTVDAITAKIDKLASAVTTTTLSFGGRTHSGGRSGGGRSGGGGGGRSGGGNTSKEEYIPAQGSVDYWENQLKEWQTKYNAAADKAARDLAEAQIAIIEKEISLIKNEDFRARWNATGGTIDTNGIGIGIGGGLDKIGEQFNKAQTIDTSKGMALAKYIWQHTPEEEKKYKNDYSASGGVGFAKDIQGGLSSMVGGLEKLGVDVDGGFGKLIDKMGAVITIITAIQTIVSAIEAIDTISTLIPFARGGMVHAAGGYRVPGNMMSGDRVPAMLNSGELVLNKAQQGNLASQLQGSNVQTSSPYVSGEQIFLGLNNYLRRSGKGEIITSR